MTGSVDVETVAKLSQRQAALADARLAEVVAERDALRTENADLRERVARLGGSQPWHPPAGWTDGNGVEAAA